MPKKRQTLTIFLLKSHVTEELAFRAGAGTQYPVNFANGDRGVLCVTSSGRNVPPWHPFLTPITPSLPSIFTSSASAMLIMSRHDRFFAVSFGYARSLLEPGIWEEDFGLKVTLNSVDATKLRSVDRMSFDAIGQHSRIQASREADINEFGLDLEQDMLRAVSGKPRNLELGNQLDGKDALRVSIKCDVDDIPHLLDFYYEQYQGIGYRDRFPWIDQIADVKNVVTVDALNQMLLAKIQEEEINDAWLAIPEIIDWSAIEGFTYTDKRNTEIHSDVHLRDYFDEVSPRNLDIPFLKRRHITAVNADGEEIKSWTVFRCLYAEVEHEDQAFVLTNGKWYSIGESFLERINEQYAGISSCALMLPNYDDSSEGAYNERVCIEQPDVFALMDEKHIVCDTYRDKVEFCDLFGREKHLIHVKRYAGSSAPLSHLFAQSLVSSTIFRRSHEFRIAANTLLPEPFRPILDQPQNSEYEVVLGIVSKSQRPLRLPFFSRVNLNSTKDRIEDLGFRLTIQKIQAVR